ncbi:MAG: tRNA (adenosine(37)-N6)-threonylcarbamoyltransferase complex dimerization subunit type 1 TsaB [Candidatus Omnitrophica bacterium]|nr:tRNA (adenosine(37)-N6)-threonylcarbamoyltransferase complex dimerization subunit type 1 TsaB [Candidatus Omnitrophota bacterium]
MKILGIDTTTRFMCIGVYDNGKSYEYIIETGHKLSTLLALHLKRILDSLGWKAQDLDYLACGLGPGSFTGIRVGVSAIKGLAWALKKPVVGVPTLDLLAENALEIEEDIAVAVDAKRSLIYCAMYQKKAGRIKRSSPYMLRSPDEFCRNVRPGSVIIGDACGIYRAQMIKGILGAQLIEKDSWYPKPENLIALVLEQIKNKKISNVFKIKPIYLYPKECQIKK